jgi:hypothetical protein
MGRSGVRGNPKLWYFDQCWVFSVDRADENWSNRGNIEDLVVLFEEKPVIRGAGLVVAFWPVFLIRPIISLIACWPFRGKLWRVGK